VTIENKKCLNGSQIGQIEITSGSKNRAWQEIASIVNAGSSVKRH